jgi:microcystin-dependent protein
MAMAAAVAVACAAAGARAAGEAVPEAVPGSVNFQARLARARGGVMSPLSGVQHVRFGIYDAPEGGTLVWSREFPVNCTEDGWFNLVLDDGGSVAEGGTAEERLVDAFRQAEQWIELSVRDVGTLLPRIRVPKAPYAFQAQHVRRAIGDFDVNDSMAVGGEVTISNALVVAEDGSASGTFQVTDGGGTIGSLTVSGTVTVPSGRSAQGKGVIPVGGIIVWTGSTNEIPDGWAVCDGENETPDLRGLFVMGANSDYSTGSTGGVARVQLSTEQIPRHDHMYRYPEGMDAGRLLAPEHKGHIWAGSGESKLTDSAGGNEHGEADPHENRPPYYAVYYIMRVK